MKVCFQDFFFFLHRASYLGTHTPFLWHRRITILYFWSNEMAGERVLGSQQHSACLAL